MKQQLCSVIVLISFALTTKPLHACAVCFGNDGEARFAFLWTTALMTFVPLTMLAVGIIVIRKLLKEHASVESAELLKSSNLKSPALSKEEVTHT